MIAFEPFAKAKAGGEKPGRGIPEVADVLSPRAWIIGLLAITAGSLAAAIGPATSLAAPSSAGAELGRQPAFGPSGPVGYEFLYSLTVGTQSSDPQAHHMVVTYDGAAIVISDTAGIAPRPPSPLNPESQNDPEDACVSADANTVRCPINLGRSDLTYAVIDIATRSGDDSLDLRSLPQLPGHRPPDSEESGSPVAAPRVIMGRGNDRLLSGPAGQSGGHLGRGNDVFVGADGDDVGPWGGRGNDRLYGGGGNDVLSGLWGNDRVESGPGRDQLFGGPGNDKLTGGRGSDVIRAIDGTRDRVSCGPGIDRARVDGIDLVNGCERLIAVKRRVPVRRR